MPCHDYNTTRNSGDLIGKRKDGISAKQQVQGKSGRGACSITGPDADGKKSLFFPS